MTPPYPALDAEPPVRSSCLWATTHGPLRGYSLEEGTLVLADTHFNSVFYPLYYSLCAAGRLTLGLYTVKLQWWPLAWGSKFLHTADGWDTARLTYPSFLGFSWYLHLDQHSYPSITRCCKLPTTSTSKACF